MALSAFDLLSCVVAAFFSTYAGRFDRLGVHYRCAGLRVSLEANSHSFAQGGMHPLPGSVQAPGAKVVVDGFPGREVVGQQPPGAAAANDVEDGVEDLTGAVHLGTPGSVGERQMRFEEGPLFVREVALVCFSHARYPTERAPQHPFSDSFMAKFVLSHSPDPECLLPKRGHNTS